MMSSKILLLLGLLLAIGLAISSEVAARDLAEASTDDIKDDTTTATVAAEDKKTVEHSTNGGPVAHPDQGGGGGGSRCRYRCCYWYHGYCRRCCSYAGESLDHDVADAKQTEQAKPGN